MNIERLEELARAATPGPWHWRVHRMTGSIELAAPHGGGTTVMDFSRHKMQGAQPRFGVMLDGSARGHRGGILMTATELIERDKEGLLRHPDAELIAACDPSTILKLVAVVRAARAVIAASDTLNDTPIGEFTGEEGPAYEAAEVALRSALEELKK